MVTTRRPSRPSWAVSRILAASQLWVAQIAPRDCPAGKHSFAKTQLQIGTTTFLLFSRGPAPAVRLGRDVKADHQARFGAL
jgi:hypothetical protein